MANPKNDNPNSQPVPANVREEANIYEDEINLIDYFLVLWKRKWFIFAASVLPALAVGLAIFLGPRDYKVTYVYDVKDQSVYDVRDQSFYDVSNWNLNENNYEILLDRFYGAENTGKIATKLQENGLNKYAERINTGGLKNFVDFEVSPPYTDLSKTKITNPFELAQIRQLEAQLLNMTIVARPENDISKISLVIRDNFENTMSVYMAKDQLNAATRGLRTQIAAIEKNRANLELTLKTNKTVLTKLKNIKTETSDTKQTNIALQFDISGKTEYLPIEYQIQAGESKIAQFEETIRADEEKHSYYENLLSLNEKLFAETKNSSASAYTIQQFRSFLIELVKGIKKEELKDYLSAYIKGVENRIAVSVPATEKPSIYAVSKGTVKKSAIVFAIALMLSVFVAFLLEGLKKSQAQAS